MGFKIKQSVPEIRIPLEVSTFDEDTHTEDTMKVVHIFNFPSTAIREKHQQKLVSVRGRKIKNEGTSEAHWYMWFNCIKSVEGYDGEDGKPLVCDKEGGWRFQFDTPILRLHIEGAVQGLLDHISANEGEEEKNLQQSSAQ